MLADGSLARAVAAMSRKSSVMDRLVSHPLGIMRPYTPISWFDENRQPSTDFDDTTRPGLT